MVLVLHCLRWFTDQTFRRHDVALTYLESYRGYKEDCAGELFEMGVLNNKEPLLDNPNCM